MTTPRYLTFKKDGFTYCVDLRNEVVVVDEGAAFFPCLEGLVSTGNLGGAEIWKENDVDQQGLSTTNAGEKVALVAALDDLRVLRKVVRAIACWGAMTLDHAMDELSSGWDDTNDEDLSGAYNEGFSAGCRAIGREQEEVFDLFQDPLVQMNARQELNYPRMKEERNDES